jgi:hypothetical protein
MVTTNDDPKAGGNTDQPDDGRDNEGRLPEPLDSAHFGNPDGPRMDLPGLPPSQPAGTGPVTSSPFVAGQAAAGGNTDQPEPAEPAADVAPAKTAPGKTQKG